MAENKKKKIQLADFDLEKELKNDFSKVRAKKEYLETRVQELKKLMRQGVDKEDFEQAQLLLNGYLAAQKVVNRITRKLV